MREEKQEILLCQAFFEIFLKIDWNNDSTFNLFQLKLFFIISNQLINYPFQLKAQTCENAILQLAHISVFRPVTRSTLSPSCTIHMLLLLCVNITTWMLNLCLCVCRTFYLVDPNKAFNLCMCAHVRVCTCVCVHMCATVPGSNCGYIHHPGHDLSTECVHLAW